MSDAHDLGFVENVYERARAAIEPSIPLQSVAAKLLLVLSVASADAPSWSAEEFF